MEISVELISEIFSRQLMRLPTGIAGFDNVNKEGKYGKRWNLFKKN